MKMYSLFFSPAPALSIGVFLRTVFIDILDYNYFIDFSSALLTVSVALLAGAAVLLPAAGHQAEALLRRHSQVHSRHR